MTPPRSLLALGAFFALTTGVAACGGDSGLSGGDVASVDGHAITKAQFDDLLQITVRGAAAGGGSTVAPDPPGYQKCIAALQKQVRPTRGQPTPTTATLKAQCRQQHDQLVTQTMTALIQQEWVELEAKDEGLSASDAEISRQLATTKRQSFPDEKAYQRFLKTSGMTQDQVDDRMRVQVLAAKILRKIQGKAEPVTEKQIKAYYQANQQQFAVPERRDIELILTRGEAKANAAKAAVQGGTSWSAAARRYSTDAASKATGGVLKGVSKGQQDRVFDQAAFKAEKGQLVGPIRGQFGWYLLRVKSISPARTPTLAGARAQIRAMLSQQGQQAKTARFMTSFQKRWRAKTDCRKDYVVELCSNAPKPRTTSTAGGTVPAAPSRTSR